MLEANSLMMHGFNQISGKLKSPHPHFNLKCQKKTEMKYFYFYKTDFPLSQGIWDKVT